MQRRLLYMQLVVVALIGVLDIHFGINERFFWTVSWWDIVLHTLGGVWVGLFGVWLFTELHIRVTLLRCVLFALAIGAGWEVFEYIAGMTGSVFMSYRLDTAKDLFDDALGGLLSYYLSKYAHV